MKLKAAYAWVENDLMAPLYFRAPVWPEHLAQLQEALDRGEATVSPEPLMGTRLTLKQPLPNMKWPWYRVEITGDDDGG